MCEKEQPISELSKVDSSYKKRLNVSGGVTVGALMTGDVDIESGGSESLGGENVTVELILTTE